MNSIRNMLKAAASVPVLCLLMVFLTVPVFSLTAAAGASDSAASSVTPIAAGASDSDASDSAGASAAAAKRPIRIGYMDYGSFIEQDEDGNYTGFGVEFLSDIAEYTGWTYEYVYDTKRPSGRRYTTLRIFPAVSSRRSFIPGLVTMTSITTISRQ